MWGQSLKSEWEGDLLQKKGCVCSFQPLPFWSVADSRIPPGTEANGPPISLPFADLSLSLDQVFQELPGVPALSTKVKIVQAYLPAEEGLTSNLVKHWETLMLHEYPYSSQADIWSEPILYWVHES